MLAATGLGWLARSAMLNATQKIRYTALEGEVLKWKYTAAGLSILSPSSLGKGRVPSPARGSPQASSPPRAASLSAALH